MKQKYEDEIDMIEIARCVLGIRPANEQAVEPSRIEAEQDAETTERECS